MLTGLPDFLFIGAMKSATTSLYTYLRSHPQIYMPTRKEIDFFSSSENWTKGLEWYMEFFTPASEDKIKGEASTSYSKYPEHPEAVDRITRVLPTARYIYCVRDPVERMISHFYHEVARGRERRGAAEALLHDPRYLAASQYGLQLERYLKRVRPERMLIIDSEELRRDRASTMHTVYGFLGVDPTWSGYADLPELYTSQERLSSMNFLTALAESRLTLGVRRRLSPPAKRRIRNVLRPRRSQARSTSSPSKPTPEFRVELRERLAPDQRRFDELRRLCAPEVVH